MDKYEARWVREQRTAIVVEADTPEEADEKAADWFSRWQPVFVTEVGDWELVSLEKVVDNDGTTPVESTLSATTSQEGTYD